MGGLFSLALPGADHVGERAEAYERGFAALVFPQQVEEGVGAAGSRESKTRCEGLQVRASEGRSVERLELCQIGDAEEGLC